MKVFLGKSTFNFLGDRDMIADTRRDMGENSGVRASLVTIQRQKTNIATSQTGVQYMWTPVRGAEQILNIASTVCGF